MMEPTARLRAWRNAQLTTGAPPPPPPSRPQWFNEEAAVEERMAEIGRIIKEAGLPTFVTLQVGLEDDEPAPCC
jgi:hypothetical protein